MAAERLVTRPAARPVYIEIVEPDCREPVKRMGEKGLQPAHHPAGRCLRADNAAKPASPLSSMPSASALQQREAIFAGIAAPPNAQTTIQEAPTTTTTTR